MTAHDELLAFIAKYGPASSVGARLVTSAIAEAVQAERARRDSEWLAAIEVIEQGWREGHDRSVLAVTRTLRRRMSEGGEP